MTTNNKLTPGFEYITNLRKMNEELEKKTHFHPEKVIKPVKSKKSFESIYLKGHLFDTHAIN